MVMTAAPADTVIVMSHLILLLYSLEFSSSGMSVKRLRSPRLLAFGTIVGVVDVDNSDAVGLSPLLGVEAWLRDVDGVGRATFISVLSGLGRISLNIVFMPRLLDMELAGTAVGGIGQRYANKEFAEPDSDL